MVINDGTLVVELKIKDASDDDTTEEKESKETELKPKKKSKAEIEAEKRKKKVKKIGAYAINQVMYDVRSNFSLSTSRYFNMSENYLLEQDMDNLMSKAGKANSLISSISIGYKVGAIGGAAGSAFGAIFATAAWSAGQAISYQSKLNGYYTSLNATKYGVGFSRERAGGLYDGGRGTEN